MLQQTQVSRVIPKYEAWLERFPDVYSLANAKVSEVLKYWSGLGYNRRALYLHECARELAKREALSVKPKENIFPQTEKELMKLPGIGKYTAKALLCFAFDKQVAVVDTNIRRVILTQFQISNETEKNIEQIAKQLLPIGHAYEWNQALMDYSSAMLRKEKSPTRLRLNFGEARQTKFKDSDRFYRGAIIRFLIKHQNLSFEEIAHLFIKNKQIIENTRLERIIKGLQKDRLIVQKRKSIFLP